MPSESFAHKLDRVRKPRVHLTYDVEIGGAIQTRELPFVVGVLADLSGKPAEALPRLKDRKFVEIDGDNFDVVMAKINPRLAFQVDNEIARDGSKINVEMRFEALDDFSPEQVAARVGPVNDLVRARTLLSNLLNKMDGNDKLEALLQDVVKNTEAQKKLSGETGRGQPQPGGAS